MESHTISGDMSDTPGSGGKEHRRHRRLLCNGFAEVIMFHPEFLFRGEVRDISQTGCFIVTRARIRLDPFAEAEIRFRLGNREFRTQALVMNVQPGSGVGFEFLGLNTQVQSQVESLIEELNANALGQKH